MIRSARFLLATSAVLYLGVGLLVLIDPNTMEELGIALITPTGITTTRTWGALFAGAGLGGLAMAVRRDWLIPGLLFMAAIGLSIFLARAFGMWFDGVELRQWVELRREGIGLGVSLMGLIIAVIGQRQDDGN